MDGSLQEHSAPELDFLNLSLAHHVPSDHLNGTDGRNERGPPVTAETNDDEGNDAEQFSVDDALGSELAALLSQVANNSGAAVDAGAPPNLDIVEPSALSNNPTSNADSQAAHGHGNEQTHEQYLTGLAAVLQAAQAMQAHGAVKSAPAFHSLNADSAREAEHPGGEEGGAREGEGEGGLSSDFSDLLAHLTAQLEQAGEQHLPNEDLSNSAIATGSGSGGGATNAPNFFTSAPIYSNTYYAPVPVPAPAPAPSSGAVPYYSGVFATSVPKSPEAGPSTREDNGKTDGKGKGKSKGKKEGRERKTFVCEYCDKSFGRKSDVTRHARIHTGDRPFVCVHAGCGKTFIQRSALHVHLRVHSGEKPHACEYPMCGRTFSDSSSLARHRRTHTGRRPYACEHVDCAKTFTRRTTLTAHMRTHDPTWEPDPNVRYSFKSKRRKTDGDEGEEDGEGEGEGDATLEDSVRTLSSLLSHGSPGGTLPHLGANAEPGVPQEGTNAPLEARVAAISAEIAAAIAQAQIQAQMFDDEEEEEEEEEESDEEEEGESTANARGMNVSGIRTEQPQPQPQSLPPFPAPTSVPVPASESASVSTPAPNHRPPTMTGSARDNEEDDEDDFPVPLRERRCKPTTAASTTGSKRKR